MKQKQTIAVVGAGVLGRLISFFLIENDHQVSLFEKNGPLPDSQDSCSLTAAGMLAPFCELEYSDPMITRLGLDSLELWKGLHRFFHEEFDLNTNGSLVITHPQDQKELWKLKEVLEIFPGCYEEVEVEKFEPLIKGFGRGLFFPLESHLDPQGFFSAYNRAFLSRFHKVNFHTEVMGLGPKFVETQKGRCQYDLVIDARGFEAKRDLANFRGVRGELFLLEAPELKFKRYMRLMHPRYPLYIVPKKGGRFIIGATSLECEDLSSMSVHSGLELLSAAFSVNPAFGEARILESRVHLRPAFMDNLPKIYPREGLIRVNGLYRHGYLAAPKLAQLVSEWVKTGKIAKAYRELLQEG
jgi:glycine oxidase